MMKLDVEVTVLSGPCFFREKLETSVRKEVGEKAVFWPYPTGTCGGQEARARSASHLWLRSHRAEQSGMELLSQHRRRES